MQSDQNGNTSSPNVLKVENLFPASGSLQAQPDVYSPGDKYVDPYYQQWNIDIQRQVWSSLLLDVGYVGSKGTHLARRLIANQAVLDADPSRPTPITSRRPYPLFGTTIRLTDNDANSSYSGLLMKAEKRFSQGLSFLLSYTYAKVLDAERSAAAAATSLAAPPSGRWTPRCSGHSRRMKAGASSSARSSSTCSTIPTSASRVGR